VTYELRPPVLHELGLGGAVASFAEQFGKLHGIPVTVDGDGQPESLDEDARALAFRSVRELLLNVVKHAHATEAAVCIGMDRDFVRIEVRDDGVGFDASGERTFEGSEAAFGLFSIRERLDHLGGRLEIDSSPRRGTKVTMFVPANTNAKAEGEDEP
jgi:signal transduction histidine kinase